MTAWEFAIVAVVIIAWSGAVWHLHSVFSRQAVREHERRYHGVAS